ncbi:MAG TPA: sulfite exporter TauE/SafE family protein [Vicinamibacteria bacterium]|nr:sulfite exporter TauE/SafE family protein [Vicinamibacteria bacterium]
MDSVALSALDLALAALAAVAAGAVNALAGGGTLITFPALTALGLPAVAANVTNTIALAPGHLGATLAQKRDLAGQRARIGRLVPAALLGGLVGGLLLLFTTEKVFRQVVPFLILLASALLAVQEPVRKWLIRRLGTHHTSHEGLTALPVFAASVYGGYFGAGLSVIVLAALGLLIDDALTRLNATKQAIGFAANGAAAVLFLFSGQVHWVAAVVMAVAAVGGGTLGGRLAGRVRPSTLRAVVVAVGVVVGLIYLLRA